MCHTSLGLALLRLPKLCSCQGSFYGDGVGGVGVRHV